MTIDEQIREKAEKYATHYAKAADGEPKLLSADRLIHGGESKQLPIRPSRADLGDIDLVLAYCIAQSARFMAAALIVARHDAEADA